MAVPTPEQLSRVSLSKKLDLFRTTESDRKNMGKTKIYALVLCGDDIMGVRTREASYVPKHESLSIFPARYRTGSLNEGIADTQERCDYSGEKSSWDVLRHRTGEERGLTSCSRVKCEPLLA